MQNHLPPDVVQARTLDSMRKLLAGPWLLSTERDALVMAGRRLMDARHPDDITREVAAIQKRWPATSTL